LDSSYTKDTSNTVKDNNIYEAKTVNDTSTKLDSSYTKDTSNTVKDNNIYEAKTVNDTSTKLDSSYTKDTSNTVKDNNIYEAKTVNDTSKMDNSSITNNADRTSSAVSTNTYTDKDGVMYKEVLGENGAAGRTRIEYTNDGLLQQEQKRNDNGDWATIKSDLNGSHKIDKSTQENYSQIYQNNKVKEEKVLEDYSFLQNFSSQSDYTTGNKNANNYATAMLLQELPKEHREAVISNMVQGDTFIETLSKVPGLNVLAPTAQSFMARYEGGKALNDIDGVKDDLYAFKQAANEIVVEKNPLLNGKAAIINLGVEAIKK
jgi:hypothetical protein